MNVLLFISVPYFQMRETNFYNSYHLKKALALLHSTFTEFRAHEQIENKFIIKRLKLKLQQLSIKNDAVCNCHKDSKLLYILDLLRMGHRKLRSFNERKTYVKELREALQEFTNDFLPHMREEEEVFQPLLQKYFSYDELRALKRRVLQEHFISEKIHSQLDEENEISVQAEDSPILQLSDEILIQIFSLLDKPDLIRMGKTCKHLHTLCLDGTLWKHINPIKWAKGDWSPGKLFRETEDNEELTELEIARENKILSGFVKYALPKIGKQIVSVDLSRSKTIRNTMLSKFFYYAPNIRYLNLSYTEISDAAFKRIGLKRSGQNLRYLNLTSCSKLTDTALLRISSALHFGLPAPTPVTGKVCSFVRFFDMNDKLPKCMCNKSEETVEKRIRRLSGDKMSFSRTRRQQFGGENENSDVKDKRTCSLENLTHDISSSDCSCPHSDRSSVLEYLSLSGCFQLTDLSLKCLGAGNGLPNLENINFSGLFRLSGCALSHFIKKCPKLKPENFYFCDNICCGSFGNMANGCANLDYGDKFCCRNGYAQF